MILTCLKNLHFYQQSKFSIKPTVLLTADHERRGIKHDAAVVWAEDITTNSFDICIRELQNFDGVHEGIHVVRCQAINYLSQKQQ